MQSDAGFNIPTKFCYCPPMPGVTETKKDSSIMLKSFLSGYQDSNLGPPAPKAGALTGLRYTPNVFLYRKSVAKVRRIF